MLYIACAVLWLLRFALVIASILAGFFGVGASDAKLRVFYQPSPAEIAADLDGFPPCRKAGRFASMPVFTKETISVSFWWEVALDMQIEKNIAAMLQSKMKETGKTKLEFSKELGIPRSTLQGYLKGDKCLRSDSIEEIAKTPGSLTGTADLRAGVCGGIRAVPPGHAPGGTPDAAPAGAGTRAGGCRAPARSIPALGGMEPPGCAPHCSQDRGSRRSYLPAYSL